MNLIKFYQKFKIKIFLIFLYLWINFKIKFQNKEKFYLMIIMDIYPLMIFKCKTFKKIIIINKIKFFNLINKGFYY